jgi:hypothetical protein
VLAVEERYTIHAAKHYATHREDLRAAAFDASPNPVP